MYIYIYFYVYRELNCIFICRISYRHDTWYMTCKSYISLICGFFTVTQRAACGWTKNHKQKGREEKQQELLIHDRLYSFDKCWKSLGKSRMWELAPLVMYKRSQPGSFHVPYLKWWSQRVATAWGFSLWTQPPTSKPKAAWDIHRIVSSTSMRKPGRLI